MISLNDHASIFSCNSLSCETSSDTVLKTLDDFLTVNKCLNRKSGDLFPVL